jgi:TfoX/Sxy family transcriptional regulator of competence genes
MAKPDHIPDPAVVAAFDRMIAGVPGVTRKGDTLPYVSINGNMYASISKANIIGLRLSEADLAEFLNAHGTQLFEGVPGHFLREYAAIPASMLDDTEFLQRWFRRSHADASALKPKKTTR